MLTFFTTPKPFEGHLGVIQRNALRSWTLLHPQAEVLLFGDDAGAVEAARDLGIRHEPEVKHNEHGTKYLTWIFDRAHELARHNLLCYVNCDIILCGDFAAAVGRVSQAFPRFLMAGRRWDTDIAEPIDFAKPNWADALRRRALDASQQRPPQWIDYFVFSRGMFQGNSPPFVIGRPGWDNWLLWYARHSGAAVVDASDVVTAIHQNHDYGYHPQGEKGVWEGEEAQKNYALLDGGRKHATLLNATHRLTREGLRRNYKHWGEVARRKALGWLYAPWFGLLNLTRPVRARLGIRRTAPSPPRQGGI